ncbi:MAG: hypothetical protein ABSF26_12415 [Thermoguttaceae bacterium]|jgi:hypothetical protein
MKRATLVALVGTGLVTVAVGLFGQRGEVMAQRVAPNTPAAGGGGDLIVLPTVGGEKGQWLTVVDPRNQAIGVYSIEGSSGKITLRSVRNIHYDLQMTDFNSDSPLPKDIRQQLEQR